MVVDRKTAFEGIAIEYMDLVYSQAWQKTADMEQTEKLVQETYAKAFDSFMNKTHIADAESWLLAILDICLHGNSKIYECY